MDYKQIMEAKELAIALPQVLNTADKCVAFIMYYVPSEGTGGTAATLAHVRNTTMTCTVDAAAPTGADAIGTAGVIDLTAATADTVAEFCNTVNATRAWKAICLCKPDTLMANVLTQSSASCLLDNGLAFYLDTSQATAATTYLFSGPITGNAFENYGVDGYKTDAEDNCVNRFHMAQFKQNFTTLATFRLYVFKQGDKTATTAYSEVITDNTHTNIGNTNLPDVPFYTAPEGYTLIAEVESDLMSTMPTLFTVLGSTVVRRNNRRVVRLPHVAA